MKSTRIESEPVVLAGAVCETCGAELQEVADVCTSCGGATRVRSGAGETDLRHSVRRAIDDRRFVLAILLGVMGPLALPVLWKSRAFSRRAKIGWTIVSWIELAVLLAAVWASIVNLIHTLEQI